MNKKENQYKSQFEFTLTMPIEYQGERDNLKADVLLLKAPSNAHKDILDKIKPIVINSFLSLGQKVSGQRQSSSNKISSSESPMDKGSVLMSLTANYKIGEVKKLFIELLTRGCCWIDKKVEATDYLISLINDVPPIDDFENLMGEYFENFLVSSWMRQLLQK